MTTTQNKIKHYHKYLLLLIAIITLAIPKISQAKISITNWQEEIHLNNKGKINEVRINAKIENLPKNTYHNNFTIIFDKKQKINIIKVKFDNRIAKYSFSNNKLEIKFNAKKFNKQNIQIEYSYEEFHKKNNQYLRQEFISAPNWISGSKASITLNIPDNLELLSLHDNLEKIDNKLIYQGIIPKTGISELIKLTSKSSIWNVTIENHINIDKKLTSLTVEIPIYFLGSGQKINNSKVISNAYINSSKTHGKIHNITYKNIEPQNINLKLKAQIKTGSDNKVKIDRDANNYLKISKEDYQLMENILKQIKNNPQYQNLPLYAKIGSFVHNYIKYEKSYVGKLLDIKSILNIKKGVCVEYATLFNALARTANIPSAIINGVANGEYDKFERHSWNLIYHKNQWIEVDPTWNLMSGIVSSSHIYFYDNELTSINAKWQEKQEQDTKVLLNSDFIIE